MAVKKAKAAPASAGVVGEQVQGDPGNVGAQEQDGASDGAILEGAQERGAAGSDAAMLANSGGAGSKAGPDSDGAEDEREQRDSESESGDAESSAARFPERVTILNHSSTSIACRVSGAVLGAGGSATVTLIDAEHANAVRKSITELAEANFIPLEKLAVEPA